MRPPCELGPALPRTASRAFGELRVDVEIFIDHEASALLGSVAKIAPTIANGVPNYVVYQSSQYSEQKSTGSRLTTFHNSGRQRGIVRWTRFVRRTWAIGWEQQ
jgi:hypothetical protein